MSRILTESIGIPECETVWDILDIVAFDMNKLKIYDQTMKRNILVAPKFHLDYILDLNIDALKHLSPQRIDSRHLIDYDKKHNDEMIMLKFFDAIEYTNLIAYVIKRGYNAVFCKMLPFGNMILYSELLAKYKRRYMIKKLFEFNTFPLSYRLYIFKLADMKLEGIELLKDDGEEFPLIGIPCALDKIVDYYPIRLIKRKYETKDLDIRCAEIIQKWWRAIIDSPHHRVGKSYLLKKFSKDCDFIPRDSIEPVIQTS